MITKNEIREINRRKRSAMAKTEVLEKSLAAEKIFLESEIYKNAKTIMLYMPLGNEVSVTEIMKAAFRDGKSLVFPTTCKKNGRITPRYVKEDTIFQKGAFGVGEPYRAKAAKASQIDVALIPGIAFDKTGARVGFGAGCYDRFLEKLSVLKVGVCYDFQLCGKIAIAPHDIRMDFLLTEKGLIKIKE